LFTRGIEEEQELSVRGLVPSSGIWKCLELPARVARSQPLRKMLPLPLLPTSPRRSEGPPQPTRAASSALAPPAPQVALGELTGPASPAGAAGGADTARRGDDLGAAWGGTVFCAHPKRIPRQGTDFGFP